MYDGTYKQALVVVTACLNAMRKNHYRWDNRMTALRDVLPAITDKVAEHLVEEFPDGVKDERLAEFYLYCSMIIGERIQEVENFYQASNL